MYATFRSDRFGLVDSVWAISIWAVSVWVYFGQTMKSCRNLACSQFYANVLKSTKNFILKLQTWWKIQQFMSIKIWFSLSSGSKLKIIIDILQLNTNSSKSWLQFRFNQNHDSSKGVDMTPIRVTFLLPIIISVVLKVVDIEPQGSFGPSKGSINRHGV